MLFNKKNKESIPSRHPKDKERQAFIQPKLKVGKPGDKYEIEADKMADQVVNKETRSNTVQKKEGEEEVQQKTLASNISPLVQMKDASEEEPIQKAEEQEESVQAKEEEEPIQKLEEEDTVQKKEEEEVQTKEDEEVQAKSNETTTASSLQGKLRKGSGGSKMDTQTQNQMESGFGTDLSQVNIHTDSEAAQMSQDVGAQAFTHGNDVYFNKGKYNPNSKEGKHLLAHELTHTIQQKGMVQKKIQKIGIDDVKDQMNGRKFILTEDYSGILKGTVVTIINWNGNNGNAQVSYITGKNTKKIQISKRVLKPQYSLIKGVSKYKVGLSGQKTTLEKSQKRIDNWKAKEASYKKNKGLWIKELTRLEDLHKKREKTMSQMLVRETMYNRFDKDIVKWVDFYNSRYNPKIKLTYNIVKSIFYQETRMGTSGRHLEKGPYKYHSNPHPIKSIYNLGQVIDSYGPQQYLMIKEMAPTIYKKYKFDQLEKHSKWKGMSNAAWKKVKIFDAIEEFSKKRDAGAKNLMGGDKDLLLSYEFWIKATVRWLFRKYEITKNWDKAIEAYNGTGAAANKYKKAVVSRLKKSGILFVGNN